MSGSLPSSLRTQRSVELSVVIPAYKEASRLPRTLNEIIPYLETRFEQFEIVIVADPSPDNTVEIARHRAAQDGRIRTFVQPSKLGKGAAVRRGCLEAGGRLVLFMDADHATPITTLDDFLPLVESAEFLMIGGVRTYQEDESRMRRVIGLTALLMAHLIVFKKVVLDSQCGFKLFTRAVVQKVFPYSRLCGGMFDVELFYLMHKLEVPCRFVPVTWNNRPGSTINIPLCLVKDPIDMLRIRLLDAMDVYSRPLKPQKQPWFCNE